MGAKVRQIADKPINRRALDLTTNPPFPFDRYDTSKYSLVEIAVEFIMWDPTGPYVTGKAWPDEKRCRFIMLAIEYNFPQDEWEAKFKEFPEAYEKGLIEEPSNEAAPVENIRDLIRKRPLRHWPAKEELYKDWPRDRGSRGPTTTQEDVGPIKSALSSYKPSAEDQIIVWVEDKGDLYIRGIYDELYATSANHGTYREFVNVVGEQAAEAALRRYRMASPTGSA